MIGLKLFSTNPLTPPTKKTEENEMICIYTKRISTMIAVVVTLAVSQLFASSYSKKVELQDSWLTAKTKIALAADSRVKGAQVSVETRKGVVTLRGKVDSDAALEAAVSIASRIDGVKAVTNDLQVVPPSSRDAVEEKDEIITERVKEHIARDAFVMKDSRLKNASIGVVTNAGVVSLTGTVSDLLVSAQASWTTWQVKGVKSVRNDLLVSGK